MNNVNKIKKCKKDQGKQTPCDYFFYGLRFAIWKGLI